jgi:hypothetical protein
MSVRSRLLIALAIGLLSGVICGVYQQQFRRGAGDISMPLCMGSALLRRADPYVACRGFQSDGVTPNTANPITTVLLTLPLLPLPRPVAAGVFFGIISATLSWGLTRDGKPWQLLIFAAHPYWQALQTVQWSPLLLATFYIPELIAVTLAKPHVGAPVALSIPWRRWPVIAAIALLLLSLIVLPTWPIQMLSGVGVPGDYRSPVMIFPGMLLLLAALRWRDRRARYLLLLSLVPQRIFYDQLLVFGVSRSRRSLLALVSASWLCFLGWFRFPSPAIPWHILLIYLPALVIVFVETHGKIEGKAEPLPLKELP